MGGIRITIGYRADMLVVLSKWSLCLAKFIVGVCKEGKVTALDFMKMKMGFVIEVTKNA
jgi:hypothetical protein